ncbi:sugar O-acetyltransferase [bacterium]|nr:sugar O-acetyltransferase [bacterium]
MTEREKMLAGENYDPFEQELVDLRLAAAEAVYAFNQAPPSQYSDAIAKLRQLFHKAPDSCMIMAPFHCDYGCFIELGDRFFANYGCVILDCGWVRIGNRVMFGPGVHLYGATHPIDPEERLAGVESGRSITIEDNVWVGGRTVINPGVTIGKNSVIGSGSVVTRDIPPGVLAAGVPARVIRAVTGG